jgi:uncharacterized membrane protein YbhN (UPF0104 family)
VFESGDCYCLEGYHIRAWDAFLYYLSSVSLGAITPGRIGEFFKVLYLKKAGVSTLNEGFSIVLVDHAYDVFLLVVLSAVGMLWLAPRRKDYGVTCSCSRSISPDVAVDY